jgi:hypothetical protein
MYNNYNNNDINEEFQRFSPDGVSPDALPLCPQCLKTVDPLDYYCPHCGSDEVINPLAAYMPFVRIRYMYSAFGKMWRKLWDGEAGFFMSIVYILLFINLAPILLVVGTPIISYKFLTNKKSHYSSSISLLIIVAGIAFLLLLSMVIPILAGLGF